MSSPFSSKPDLLNPTNKKILSLSVIIGIILLFFIMGYGVIQIASQRVHENVLKFLAPIAHDCTQPQGCPTLPHGWIEVSQTNTFVRDNLQDLPDAHGCASPPPGSPYQTLIYCATPQQFIVRWPYLSNAQIIVTGGQGHPMELKDINT